MAEDKFQGERPAADVGERVIEVPGLTNEKQAQAIINDPNSEVGRVLQKLQKEGKHFHISWKSGEIRILISGIAALVGFAGGLAVGLHERKRRESGPQKSSRRKKESFGKNPNPRRKR